MGGCFLWAVFLKSVKVTQIIGLLFPLHKLFINIGKNGLGYILGDFISNLSGHPGAYSSKHIFSHFAQICKTFLTKM
jgi:hypothetical protein